jgi:hypothetical protein
MLAAPAQPRLPQTPPRSAAAAPSRLPMNPFGPAAAKPSANWDAHHAGVPHRRHSPKVPGFPQRSEASRSSTIAAVAPDPTEPRPCSRLPICLQINQQAIAGKASTRKAVPTGGLPWLHRFHRCSGGWRAPSRPVPHRSRIKTLSKVRRTIRRSIQRADRQADRAIHGRRHRAAVNCPWRWPRATTFLASHACANQLEKRLR